jgi:hypothetical protein
VLPQDESHELIEHLRAALREIQNLPGLADAAAAAPQKSLPAAPAPAAPGKKAAKASPSKTTPARKATGGKPKRAAGEAGKRAH